jgi:hypothetical protein
MEIILRQRAGLRIWLILLLVFLLGSLAVQGCDASHGSALRNGTTTPIRLRVTSNDGLTHEIVLEPRQELQKWDRRLEYLRIDVYSGEGLLYSLDVTDIKRLEPTTRAGHYVLNLERTGLRLVPRSALPEHEGSKR